MTKRNMYVENAKVEFIKAHDRATRIPAILFWISVFLGTFISISWHGLNYRPTPIELSVAAFCLFSGALLGHVFAKSKFFLVVKQLGAIIAFGIFVKATILASTFAGTTVMFTCATCAFLAIPFGFWVFCREVKFAKEYRNAKPRFCAANI